VTLAGKKIWNLFVRDSATEGHIYDECIEKGIALLGFGANADYSGVQSRQEVHDRYRSQGEDISIEDYGVAAVHTFVRLVKPGDLILVSEGNLKLRAIGEIVGEYHRVEREGADSYSQARSVRWLRVYSPALPYSAALDKRFMMKSIYELRPGTVNLDRLDRLLNSDAPAASAAQPHVLIIDEINRGSVSRIFGELITLIEPSKREGSPEMLEVVLPYSKDRFSVPGNVYLIGTMNTADRSLTGLDIALRRRFDFVEMPPRPDLLTGVSVGGVPLKPLLEIMNQRIEALLDRDHALGHAYFMALSNGDPLDNLARVFRNQIIPLLQEYFFEDWERIHWVLNDHRKAEQHRFIVATAPNAEALFGQQAQVPGDATLWGINPSAFEHAESFLGIVG